MTNRTHIRLISAFLLSILLTACGGGGGGGGSTGPTAQTIAFATTGSIDVDFNDATYTNLASGGDGTGAISYESLDTSVATVDASSGVVSFVSAGTVTIRANKAADATHAAATSDYTLNISFSTVQFPFSAWVGELDTQVTFPASAVGLSFLRSRDVECAEAFVTSCTLGTITTLTADANDSSHTSTVTDNAATLTNAAYYKLTASNGESKATATSLTKFAARTHHQTVAFDDRLWVIGGNASGAENDIWSSTNGETWIQETAGAEFSARQGHQVVAFDNKIWLFGGSNSSASEVWFTSNGKTWNQDHTAVGFSGRSHLRVIEFDNKLWMVGGREDGLTAKNDVWSSSNGTDWTEVTSSAQFGARSGHALFTLNDKLWLMGGLGTNAALYNDIWSTTDGITWTEESANNPAAFSPRYDHSVTSFANKLWLIGGRNIDTSNPKFDDIWTSEDGTTWTQQTDDAAFGVRTGHSSTVFDNELWIIAGDVGSSTSDDAWSSSDGSNWTKENAAADFTARSGFQTIVYNDKLWLFGGVTSNNQNQNDIWSSEDGIAWNNESQAAGFSARSNHQVAVDSDGDLWMVGGNDGLANNDVYTSTNGTDWSLATTSASPFQSREDHQLASFNNALWIIGGKTGQSVLADIWGSSNGISWSNFTGLDSDYFGARYGHQLTTFGDKLLLIAGENGSSVLQNDVWESTDGQNWTDITTPTPDPMFTPRKYHQAVQFGSSLYVVGGLDDSGVTDNVWNDVWRSTDGSTWEQLVAEAPFAARHSFQLEVYDNKLWVIGGIDASGNKLNDVWQSSDAINWRRGTRNSIFLKLN